MIDPLLSVKGLTKEYSSRRGMRRGAPTITAVDGVSFDVERGTTFSLVGESGCGKSTTARCIVRIIEPTAGKILLNGADISHMGQKELRAHRRHMQMVFQDPQASLNPRQMVSDIIAEPLVIRGVGSDEIRERVENISRQVQLRPEDLHRYPHQFSGGQRQRIGIARALILGPDLLVLDEPVSALDVSVQAQIARLLQRLRDEMDLAYVLISHDLAVVRHLSDHVGVMYMGTLVEVGPAEIVYASPLHPYTQALISAAPIADPDEERSRRRIVLAGDPPDPVNPPSGCRFRARCAFASDRCAEEVPTLSEVAGGHSVACHHPVEASVAIGSPVRKGGAAR